MIKVDVSNVINEEEIAKYSDKVASINKMINEKTGAGNDFLGWVDWPNNYDKEELERLINDAKYVRENFDVLVVAGIGGSYLGARSALYALKGIKEVYGNYVDILNQKAEFIQEAKKIQDDYENYRHSEAYKNNMALKFQGRIIFHIRVDLV